MKIIEKLERYGNLYRRRLVIGNQLNLLKHTNGGVKGISYDGIQTSQVYDRSNVTEDTAMEILSKREQLEGELQEVQEELNKIESIIDKLEDIEKHIIIQRYIHKNQWWYIASTTIYSIGQCKDIHSKAIGKLKRLL